MTTINELDGSLLEALQSHSARYSPFYQGFLSDHGPMGAMALHGLGKPEAEVAAWLNEYCGRLSPLEEAPIDYQSLLGAARQDLEQLGAEALLARDLPALISGWARGAYHPLIRLAYGYQFQIAAEIAAGLAYLRWYGSDEVIEQLSATATPVSDASAAFAAMSACATTMSDSSRFDDRLALVIGHPSFAAAAVSPHNAVREISRLALSAFDATHDFFALHLVTGAHAFRLLYPFAGAQRDEIFTLGILAGYASIGAPDLPGIAPTPQKKSIQQNDGTISHALKGNNDHDIKLAYSCREQSTFFDDPGYAEVAIRYLSNR